MTQTLRWLAALTMLVAFGACAVRAEEEESVRPPRVAGQALPPPLPVLQNPVVSTPQAVPALTLPVQFGVPYPNPSPAAAYLPCPQPCPVCPASFALVAPTEFMVHLVVCKAAAGGGCEVLTQPQVCALENQTATVEVCTGADPKERSAIRMQLTTVKHGDGALVDLSVEDCRHDGDAGLQCTEMTKTRCQVALGATTKVLLSENTDGSPRSWVELTVKEMPHPQQAVKPASAEVRTYDRNDVEDADPSPVECVAEVIQCLFETVADAASGLFTVETSDQPPAAQAHDLMFPPQYFAPTPLQPMVREIASCPAASCPADRPCCTQCPAAYPCRPVSVGLGFACTQCPATCPNCPAGCGAGCIQCVATEDVKKQSVHIGIDTLHHRVVMESSDGKKCMTASADHITVCDDCLSLEGNVSLKSVEADGAVNTVTGDKLTWKLPKGVEYKIGD